MTSSVADALVGRVIDGRYRILSHLADGGMASVYVALDGRLDREVALKIMRPGLATDDVFVERFRAEARSAARLSHPNVVAVYDQGEDDGEVFLAMELVEGKTLRDVIHEEAPLTARESLAILEPILLALRAAHAAGMIHRDVKPENVIVRRDGEVKVADFGLARAITNQAATSQTGVLLGTVSYLSPEQVERGVADTRSDVYAAGLLLFEMLTGRKAVTGGTPIQIAYNHVHGSIVAPSTLVPGVPEVLDDLVARATAVEPDDRFESATTFVTALREVRRGLSAGELDRRATAVGTDPAGTAVLAPVSSTTQLSPTDRPRRSEAAGSPERHRTRPHDMGPAALAGLPVHEDGPALEHTAAMPIERRRRRGARRRWPLWLAGLLLVGGVSFGGWWFTAGPGGSTLVPAVVGQPVSQAEGELQQAALSTELVEEFSETKAQGVVLSVEPGAGSELGKDSTVRLVVSKGKERYAVPTLVGSKVGETGAALSPLNLRLGERSQAWSETVPEGVVISQDPAAGESVKRNTAVSVVVSKGRRPIEVPTVTGATFDAASATLTKAGLTVQRGEDVNSDTVPAGQVVSQSPDKGTLHRGDAVKLVVSKGPVMVQVPNVVDQPDAAADKALTDLGLKVDKQYPFGDLFEKKVRAQDPAAGTSVPKGTTIHLTIV
ncbi:Stk1 family PASTA domain-containing Ser/Thr kinase [Terrabacter sp. C0L_2]|uniref:Stk1 family PASTA domain-containing Ser/Thr kinase n=1 Tax=Terrabacter sp. C0L_2 TaxID=3108389 RepID=UPI002ED3C06A|nr:Stk1 family PASTA domain-containing Ser/Thr kinase [Terrabacter sp. C0L_2]